MLDRLDLLQAELAALDPAGEIAVADRVAAIRVDAMARALREAAAAMRRHGGDAANAAEPAPHRAAG